MKKTEDEIERERKAVQSLVGAKGAVEKVLARNDRLTHRNNVTISVLEEIKKCFGDLYIRTYRHKPTSSHDSAHFMKISDYIDAEIKAIREVL